MDQIQKPRSFLNLPLSRSTSNCFYFSKEIKQTIFFRKLKSQIERAEKDKERPTRNLFSM